MLFDSTLESTATKCIIFQQKYLSLIIFYTDPIKYDFAMNKIEVHNQLGYAHMHLFHPTSICYQSVPISR